MSTSNVYKLTLLSFFFSLALGAQAQRSIPGIPQENPGRQMQMISPRPEREPLKGSNSPSIPNQPEHSDVTDQPKQNNGQMKVSEVPLRAQEILNFWFGNLPSENYFPMDKMDVWFAATPEIDREIRENFTSDVNTAVRGELNSWRDTPLGRLALILLLDQFPRHVYRHQSQSFASDPMARGLVLEGLQRGDDRFLYPLEKAFFYLPLEHAEDFNLQNLSVRLYRQLYLEAPLGVKPQMESFYEYALIHQRQIARFGRFPHRNMILRRPPTPEEMTFLREGK